MDAVSLNSHTISFFIIHATLALMIYKYLLLPENIHQKLGFLKIVIDQINSIYPTTDKLAIVLVVQ